MKKIEYIRASHREANRKIWVWLDGVRQRLDGRSRVLGWLWLVIAWIIYGVVWVVSWLAFVSTLFRDVRYTLHFMEWETGDLPPEEARAYLLDKQQEHTRRLSYGSVPAKEQKRIDKVFEYLFAKYPAPAPHTAEPLPDMSAERHAEMIESIVGVKTAIVESAATENERRNREGSQWREKETERHSQVIGRIDEVKTAVDSVAGYTDRKEREDSEREEKDAAALAAAEKRRQQHLSKSGFEPHPKDFSPKLSNRQISVLTERMNDIGVFKRDVTVEEITRLLLCEHKEPLQSTHNKIIALILENLSIEGLITPKWQMVAGDKKCFTSKMGKLLTAKDLSSAKQMAEFINEKKYKKILDGIEAVKKAK
jgi:hypothetical protein